MRNILVCVTNDDDYYHGDDDYSGDYTCETCDKIHRVKDRFCRRWCTTPTFPDSSTNIPTTSDRVPCPTPTLTNGISDEGTAVLTCSSNKENSVGSIVGAGIGGAVFGAAVTVLVFVCGCQRRERLQKREALSQAVGNPSYHKKDGKEKQLIQDKGDRKSAVYNEIIDEMPTHSQDISTEKQGGSLEPGVYDLLNETDISDKSEYYDHAKPVPSQTTQSDGYESVQIGIGGISDHQGEKTEGKRQPLGNDEYFVVEEKRT
ncbi:uncharacterized protein LOC125655315 isoform X2 [Ostrea edulis]|uniref:uncharacterized protein LOC125655315 isoform X2 n=1 Tax=Ostrea edulis TaxID=37623 RepID=UPI0024AFF885|nr:uncharacterized protein LOC125655315 isoform X2 [Ostrea edulis]